ncbi:hypothetical protein CBM2609_A60074 [Cupriavidus taiwanensis]|nr:hypothetical protein CBM2604_A50073 [Cupriavidus taiwanensis]SOZ27477.1 hypothetical protein CBM2609_A60074 [Cupriavidus taiwanensis]SOZ45804.1 hypothetical protein CBM2610_A70072 [Cupriavidus taiwanensis]
MPPPCGGIVFSGGGDSGAILTLNITRLKSNRKVHRLNSHVCAFRHPKSRHMTGRATT